MELRYHRLGTDSTDDTIVLVTPDQPEWGFLPNVSEDGRTLIVTIWRGTGPQTRIYVADLSGGVGGLEVGPLLDRGDAVYIHVATIGRTVYLRTDLDAPLGRIVAIDLDEPDWIREVVAEAGDQLETAALVGGRLAIDYLHDAHHRLNGGFQVAIGPIFKSEWLAWLDRGGLLAVASLRGGSEYGKPWHDAARLANKQNVFDDVAARARCLAASWLDKPRPHRPPGARTAAC
jgi:prolyl oligopeptidase PreP (S9A serine peptidase family)